MNYLDLLFLFDEKFPLVANSSWEMDNLEEIIYRYHVAKITF